MGDIESILFPDLGVDVNATKSLSSKVEKKRKISGLFDDSGEDSVTATEVPIGVCHYKTGKYEPLNNHYLPEEICSVVQDCVVGCRTNILILHKEKVLLGKWVSYPQMSWWFSCGGCICPGLTPKENCRQILKCTLGIDVNSISRFEYVGSYSCVWGIRCEHAEDQNSHNISVVYAIHLEMKELPKSFSKADFFEMRWVSMRDIVPGDYHPALYRAIRDYSSASIFSTLFHEVVFQKETDVSVIGEKFKVWSLLKIKRQLAENKVMKDDKESTDEHAINNAQTKERDAEETPENKVVAKILDVVTKGWEGKGVEVQMVNASTNIEVKLDKALAAEEVVETQMKNETANVESSEQTRAVSEQNEISGNGCKEEEPTHAEAL